MSNESGATEVYVRSMPLGAERPGPAVRISTTGGSDPVWSADGKELFFNTPDDRLMASRIKIQGDRFEREEPQVLFPLGGTSSFNGATYWQPFGNGSQFIVLRSAPAPGADNSINILINWQSAL